MTSDHGVMTDRRAPWDKGGVPRTSTNIGRPFGGSSEQEQPPEVGSIPRVSNGGTTRLRLGPPKAERQFVRGDRYLKRRGKVLDSWPFSSESRVRVLVGASSVLLVVGLLAILVGQLSENESQTRVETVVQPTPVAPETSDAVSSPAIPIASNSEWEKLARSVVLIEARGSRCEWIGSGSIVGDGSYVLTNQHVSGDGECDLIIWLTDSTADAPSNYLRGEVVVSDAERDLAVVRMLDSSGQPFVDSSRVPMTLSVSVPKLGEKITILGYPGLGGETITLTSGDFSGVDKSENFDYYKTTANMNPGVSGGAALNSEGELVGIPTAGRGAEIACEDKADCVANGSTIGLLRPAGLAKEILDRITG